jgi:hypothetical protein
MGKLTSSKVQKVCATCALWAGTREPMAGGFVQYDNSQKGKCVGGGFNNAPMVPTAGCSKWELWGALR